MRRLDMSSIGFAALGRTLIKNNRAQRPESKRSVSLTSKITRYADPKKASPQLLHKIKTEIEAQHRKRNKTLLLIGGIIFIILATTLWFLKDQNYI